MNEPRNELEKYLVAANDGQLSSDDLLQILRTMQVFMPVQDEKSSIQNFQQSARAKPLVLPDENGGLI